LEAAASAAAESSGSRLVTPEAPRTESDSPGESDSSDEEFQEPGTPQETGSQADDDEEDPTAMASAYVHPPTFTGGEKDDPKDWLERYEIAAQQNNWNDVAKVSQFGAYMDGVARQWYTNVDNRPGLWADTPAAGNTPAVVGLRSAFLNEFQSSEYKRALQKKLKNRRQSPKEPLMTYFWDVIDLCKKVDPNMSETDQVKHATDGLLPKLKEKIIPYQVTTKKDFIKHAKLLMEAVEAGMEEEMDDATDVKEQQTDQMLEILQLVKELVLAQGSIAGSGLQATVERNPAPGGVPILAAAGQLTEIQLIRMQLQQLLDERSKEKGWTDDGRGVGFKCKRVGHLKKDCPETEKQESPAQEETSEEDEPDPDDEMIAKLKSILARTRAVGINCVSWAKLKKEADKNGNREQQSELSRVLTISVNCNGTQVKAIVDTGAESSIISPTLAKECKGTHIPWSGADFILANGKKVRPAAAAIVQLALENGQVIESAVAIMEMGSIKLLLGNDTLRRFRVLTVNYQQQDDGGAPQVTLGEFSTSPEVEQPLQKKRKTTMSGRYDQMGRRREVKAAMSGRRRQPTRDTSAE
jgi:hypothetical protein